MSKQRKLRTLPLAQCDFPPFFATTAENISKSRNKIPQKNPTCENFGHLNQSNDLMIVPLIKNHLDCKKKLTSLCFQIKQTQSIKIEGI